MGGSACFDQANVTPLRPCPEARQQDDRRVGKHRLSVGEISSADRYGTKGSTGHRFAYATSLEAMTSAPAHEMQYR